MDKVNLTAEQIVLAETLSNEKVTVSETDTVVVDQNTAITIVTGLLGPKGRDGIVTNLGSIPDVDLTNLSNGSLLIYSTAVQKWQSSTVLQDQTLESGQY